MSRFLNMPKKEAGYTDGSVMVAAKQSGAKVCTYAPLGHHLQAMTDTVN